MTVIFIFMLSLSAHAVDLSGLAPYVHFHDHIVSKLKDKSFNGQWKLLRYDADLAVDASGEIGLFGVGTGAGAELIWERKNSKKDVNTELAIDDKAVQTGDGLLRTLAPVLELHRWSNRRILRLVRYLEADAHVIRAIHDTLARVPEVAGWRPTGFFRIYEFSTGLELGSVGGEYEKRVRIRFRVNQLLEKGNSITPTEMKVTKILHSLGNISNSAAGNPEAFHLSRAWIRSDSVLGIDLAIFEKSITKGIVIQFERLKKVGRKALNSPAYPNIPGELILPPISDPEFPLSQVRLRLSTELEHGFMIATLGKETTVDLHYFRGKQ